MNTAHLNLLCQSVELGSVLNPVTRIYGGLLHMMWRVDTNKSSYAVKQLTTDIDLTNTTIVENYNLTEKISSYFADKGIPAICAIKKLDQALFIIDNIGYLVYPYVEAKPLGKDEISVNHALNIAGLIAKIHLIDLHIPTIIEPEFYNYDNNHITDLVKQVSGYNFLFTETLNKNLKNILEINEQYLESISLLKQHSVISHGDLDQKNVLWTDKKQPWLIDWESARKLNPTYEIINAALDWSGITKDLNISLFHEMLRAYIQAGGLIEKQMIKAAFYGVLGNWINWMVYNIKRSMNSEDYDKKSIGIEQVIQVLHIIIRVKSLMPKLINEIKL